MSDEGAPQSPDATNPQDERYPAPPPELVVRIPLEGSPTAQAGWWTAEDAQRLRANLIARDLANEVCDLLDRVVPEIRRRSW